MYPENPGWKKYGLQVKRLWSTNYLICKLIPAIYIGSSLEFFKQRFSNGIWSDYQNFLGITKLKRST